MIGLISVREMFFHLIDAQITRLISCLNQVWTRAATARNHINSKEDILIYATKLLKAELPLSLRLMG
jgi:hypothetical protein